MTQQIPPNPPSVVYAPTAPEKSGTMTNLLRGALAKLAQGGAAIKSASLTLKAHRPIPKRLLTDAFNPPEEEKKAPPPPPGPRPEKHTERILTQTPELCPFLRRFLYETYKKDTWKNFSTLSEYRQGIKEFYKQELLLRHIPSQEDWKKIDLNDFLSAPVNWVLAEQVLQEHDRPNLEKIMSRLIPLLRNKGYLQPPQSVDAPIRMEIDCFEALWEMTRDPRMLNKLEELNFSKLGLTEIPLSFARLYFSQVIKLSFADNKIEALPRVIIDVTPTEDGRVVRKTYNVFSRYPNLKVLDFSDCLLSSIDGVFSFLSPSSDGMERVHVLPNLEEALFRKNMIASLPQVFGIAPHHLAKSVLIDVSGNVVDEIHQATLEDLALAKETHVTLNLDDDQILYEFVNSHQELICPSNVSLVVGQASYALEKHKKIASD